MAAFTPTTITQISESTWYFEWTALGAGVFAYVYRNRRLINKTLANFCYVMCETAQDVVEFFDSASDVPTTEWAVSVPRIQWEREPGATLYRIAQYVGAAWTEIGIVPDTGGWMLPFNCPEVSVAGLYKYRVTPVVDGVDGIPQIFSFYIVPPPAQEEYAATWNDTTGVMSFDNA